ncbi:hypothetical protein [Kitasatospora sp. NPDC001175]|uniref:hypothetical protein n=1 Tax=Kitasatospora sp. NPDC001175 TaxID=3157103 RepID=UPI003D08FF32
MTTAQAPAKPSLAELLEQTSPAIRARRAQAATIPVHPLLAPLLPHGGLARGTVTETTDLSLLLALAAGPADATPTTWSAAINLPDLGLAAAIGHGIPINRLLLVDEPGEHLPEVIAALAPVCSVLLIRPPTWLQPRTTTRLAAHLRRTGTVLLSHGPWPGGAQLRLEITTAAWSGLGDGYGQLLHRRVTVRASGGARRAHERPSCYCRTRTAGSAFRRRSPEHCRSPTGSRCNPADVRPPGPTLV